MNISLITPPFTQLSSPYPATAFLKGTLNHAGHNATQYDLSIETALKLFSKKGLELLFDETEKLPDKPDFLYQFLLRKEKYIQTIDRVIEFLQGKNPNLAYKIADRDYLPEGERFTLVDEMGYETFSNLEMTEGAKLLASLYIDDLTDFAREGALPFFGLSKYRESLGLNAIDFNKIISAMEKKPDLIAQFMFDAIDEKDFSDVKMCCITIPFPGNLYGALLCGRYLKEKYPDIKIVFGGGYINTELRELEDHRIFNYCDFITLDDGETPLLSIADFLEDKIDESQLKRTFVKKDGKVVLVDGSDKPDLFGDDLGMVSYDGLPLDKYFSITETTNPMLKLWSERNFLKLRTAHGCYWKKCTFCDTSLDYIQNYKTMQPETVIAQIENIIKNTGIRNFHFADEAMPPAFAKKFAFEIIKRDLDITWWGNFRFEKQYTPDFCRLLKKSGCIAVSAGLEAVTEDMLKLVDKGITLKDAVCTMKNFTEAGIMVHTYLIYDLPTQTAQDIVDSLEILRQMFSERIVHSAYWHRFSLTVHSPIYQDPKKYQLKILGRKSKFANNDIAFRRLDGLDFTPHGDGLNRAVFNYMEGNSLNTDVRNWFDVKVPKQSINRFYINSFLKKYKPKHSENSLVIWTGSKPFLSDGEEDGYTIISAPFIHGILEYELPENLAEWIYNIMINSSIDNNYNNLLNYTDIKSSFPENMTEKFEDFIKLPIWEEFKEAGLYII